MRWLQKHKRLVQVLLIIVIAAVVAARVFAADSGKATVFLISLDGIRPDYLERADTPFLDELMADGVWSMEMVPVFPSATFPSHVSIATGVAPEQHGITANSFYDNRTQRLYRYPGDAALLEAEPIWTTASRQGVRTLVLDWVMAHNQTGPYATAYFGERYSRGLSDEERIGKVLQQWEEDTGDEPIRFILAYGESPDKEGHRYGPDAPEVAAAMAEGDSLLRQTYDKALALWRAGNPGDNDSFYFVVLSDHGMSSVDALVNLVHAADIGDIDGVRWVTTGNVGHVFFDQVDAAERQQVLANTLTNLQAHDFLRVYRRDDIPEAWGYRHPHRVGDLVVVLDQGLTFSARASDVSVPVETVGGPLGMHGYHPEEDPNMNTVLVVHRYPQPLGGGDLGRVDSLRIHALLARILDIEPAEGAKR